MKRLKKLIKEEIKKLQEREYPIPDEILFMLRDRLKLNPLIRYVKNLKAVNSVPPSYRIFFHNGAFFDLIYEDFSLLAKVGSKEYFLNDIDERNYAIKDINRLLTGPSVKPEEEEEEDLGADMPDMPDMGGDAPTPPPPPPPAAEPPEEPEA